MPTMPKKKRAVTKADVEKQARAMGLGFELTEDHDWPAVSVYLDMIGEHLLPQVAVVNRQLIDNVGGDRVHGETERDYWRSVEATAEEIAGEIRAGDIEHDDGEFHERLDQEADGSHWVIYNHAQLATLVFSRNRDAIDDIEEELHGRDLGEVLQRAAYFAFRADIEDAVGQSDTSRPDDDEDE